VTPAVAFPTLGVGIARVRAVRTPYRRIETGEWTVSLVSTFPNHTMFQRRIDNGDWQPASADDVLPTDQDLGDAYTEEYRSVDSLGNYGMSAVLRVLVSPRADARTHVITHVYT